MTFRTVCDLSFAPHSRCRDLAPIFCRHEAFVGVPLCGVLPWLSTVLSCLSVCSLLFCLSDLSCVVLFCFVLFGCSGLFCSICLSVWFRFVSCSVMLRSVGVFRSVISCFVVFCCVLFCSSVCLSCYVLFCSGLFVCLSAVCCAVLCVLCCAVLYFGHLADFGHNHSNNMP